MIDTHNAWKKKLSAIMTIFLLCSMLSACTPMQTNVIVAPNGKVEDRQLWNRVTQSFKLKYQYNCDNNSVQNQVRFLENGAPFVTKMATQAEPYLYYVFEEVRKRNLPGELALLPMIESAYNPFAYSRTGAAGLWQIMPGTGTGFGLRQNWWYDDRRDVVASTKAALDYLTYLQHIFNGNWLLAIASYNSGEGTVMNAIRWNTDHGLNTDFWSLPLPRETQDYVPRLLAMACILKNPHRHPTIYFPPVKDEPYLQQIVVNKQVDLGKAAKHANISTALFHQLNPGYNRRTTQPNSPAKIILPINKIELFKANLAKNLGIGASNYKQHTVKRGETLAIIAQNYHTTPKLIQLTNNLRTTYLRTGNKLMIPLRKSNEAVSQYIAAAEKRYIQHHFEEDTRQQFKYTVSSNDETLASIAAKLDVMQSQLRYWNKLPPGHQMRKGEKLVIWREPKKYFSVASNTKRRK